MLFVFKSHIILILMVLYIQHALYSIYSKAVYSKYSQGDTESLFLLLLECCVLYIMVFLYTLVLAILVPTHVCINRTQVALYYRHS